MLTRLLALTLLLLPLRLDAGQNVWTPIGPDGGPVTALAVAPNGRTVYAGTPIGGVFKSINTGRSWNPVNEGLGRRVIDLEVAATAPQVVYAATWEGLFQSRNAGASWTDLTPRLPGISGPATPVQVVTSPIEPGAVYAVLITGELFRSSDAGATWERVAGGLPPTVRVVAPHPRQPGVVFASTTDGVYRSSDSGRTWRRSGLARFDVVQIAFDPLRPERLYAVRSLDGEIPNIGCEVYVSEQGGQRWQKAGAGIESGRNARLVADPFSPGTAYLSVENSRGSLYKTSDGGRRWRTVAEGYAIWDLAANPGVRDMLFLARPHYDGTAVLRSTDAGRSWTASASGIRAQEVRKIVTASPGVLYTHADCCKPWKTEDGGLTWTSVGPALPPSRRIVDIAVDPTNPTTVYVSVNNGSLFRSLDAGATWSRIAFPSATTLPLTDLQVDPDDPDALYGLYQARPIKSTNGGADWAPLPYSQDQGANVLAAVPGPSTTLYANGMTAIFGGLSYEDRVNRSTDGGATWTSLLTVQDTFFTDFAADPRLPGRILASSVRTIHRVRLPVAGGVYLSTDDGLHWNRFPADPQTLPPLFSLALDHRHPIRVYVGAAGAVFLSEDGGVTWTDIGAGLPPVNVVDLQVDPDSPDTVYAATFGGSVYAFTRTSGN